MESSCANCNKDQTQLPDALKNCARCRAIKYCSRECQRQHWKTHKKVCALGTSDASQSSRPRFAIDKPFGALQDGTWLRNRPAQDVYQLLSDVFRMRREDQYKYEQSVEEGSIYAGASASSELKNFRRFLENVTKIDAARPTEERLLPSWWSTDALEQCVEVAATHKDAMVAYAVEKHDIQEFYGQDDMPMQLRMFGEALDGTTIMGQGRDAVLNMKVAVEQGQFHGSTISVA